MHKIIKEKEGMNLKENLGDSSHTGRVWGRKGREVFICLFYNPKKPQRNEVRIVML